MYLEASWAPVHKVDLLVDLHSRYGSIDILWDNIPSVQKADCHVLSIPWITLDHLVLRLKAVLGELLNSHPLMVSLIIAHQGTIGGKGKMDPGVGHKVCLELCHVDIESPIKSQRRCDGGDNLGNEPVQVCVCWTGDLKLLLTNVIDGLIVHKEGNIAVL